MIKLAVILCFCFMNNALSAGTFGVRGKVYELGTSEPIQGVIVAAPGTTLSAQTDSSGSFQIGPVSENSKLAFTADGFAEKTIDIGAAPASGEIRSVHLDRIGFTSDAVVVIAKRQRGEALTSSLGRDDIKMIPGTAGDAVRAVVSLPGVEAPNDFISQLVVQGGSPSDNLYLIDNLPWPFPFHLGGILSTVNPNILSFVELNSAGFGAKWGNKLGAVLFAKTRPGKSDRLHFIVDVNLVTSQIFAEGPLGLGDAVFSVAGRRSYADLFFGKMIKGFTALPHFWDTSATLDFTLGRDNSIHALVLATADVLKINPEAYGGNLGGNFSGEFSMDNSAFTGGFNWVNTSVENFVFTLTPYYYNTFMKDSAGTGFNIDLRDDIFGVKLSSVWEAGKFLEMKHELGFGAGCELIGEKITCYIYEDLLNKGATDYISMYIKDWNFSYNFYMQDLISLTEALDITAGLRYDKNGSINRDKLLPRVGLEWRIDELLKCKMAWGYYGQFPDPLQTDKNIGNEGLKPNLAEHAVVSIEKTFTRGISGRLSAYYKYYKDLVLNVQDGSYYANAGTGMAKGLEFFLRGDFDGRLTAWLSYSFSKSERMGPPSHKWVSYQYDEPHNLTLAASYKILPVWSTGLKLHYNSGPLKKRMLSSYKNAFYIADGLYSDTDESRLDDYLRLDIRTDYEWRFEGWSLKVYLEVVNLLNRINPQGLIYPNGLSEAPQVINNLPIMPYLGCSAEF